MKKVTVTLITAFLASFSVFSQNFYPEPPKILLDNGKEIILDEEMKGENLLELLKNQKFPSGSIQIPYVEPPKNLREHPQKLQPDINMRYHLKIKVPLIYMPNS
jgi:hypothetical protein